jgi:hypothetical protein
VVSYKPDTGIYEVVDADDEDKIFELPEGQVGQ